MPLLHLRPPLTAPLRLSLPSISPLTRPHLHPHSYVPRATLSTTTRLRAENAHPHEEHYDPPTGWLWGVPPGEKREPVGWERVWFWGFFGSLAVGVVGYAFKPDTSIQTWALEEARRRLEAEGILQDPGLIEGDTKAQTTE